MQLASGSIDTAIGSRAAQRAFLDEQLLEAELEEEAEARADAANGVAPVEPTLTPRSHFIESLLTKDQGDVEDDGDHVRLGTVPQFKGTLERLEAPKYSGPAAAAPASEISLDVSDAPAAHHHQHQHRPPLNASVTSIAAPLTMRPSSTRMSSLTSPLQI